MVKLKKSQLKELIKQAIVQELKFGSKAQYDKYKKDHNIKPGTEIDIAGKKSKEKAPLKTSKAREKESDKFADAENAKLDAAEKAAKKKKKGKVKSNPFSESTVKRFTVKEVQKWMKTLEENRYKKVYNADCRRVSWMANNEGVEISEMPKSMSKKWTKAQYGRERYLANEFLKSKKEQMIEHKLRQSIRGILLEGIGFPAPVYSFKFNCSSMIPLIIPLNLDSFICSDLDFTNSVAKYLSLPY